ncbi:serine/threonine-protein kinase [Actinomadura sp. 21ATH]|uniref:serine/threonine-protein kinase n=1 Tax=Actinomadura sp. 21ATH TaxID=1735444 RepID=UPI0035C1EF52
MDERIGPYRLERLLGSGGMGVVHLARGPGGERVALKVMHAQWSAHPEYRERFRDEAEAARRVARFCTAAVLDASFGEPAYLVTEYIEGETLSAALVRDGVLDGGRLESVAVGTAVALGAIHRAGIVHRDLKPSNIILSPYGPKVIDFGIAQIENTEGRTGPFVFGTPPVIAPERFEGHRATVASDVFSWGCVVAYAGTGRWPYGSGALEVVHYRSTNRPPDLDGLDVRLAPLVRSALAPDPAARPTIAELLDEMTGSGLQITQAMNLADLPRPPDGEGGSEAPHAPQPVPVGAAFGPPGRPGTATERTRPPASGGAPVHTGAAGPGLTVAQQEETAGRRRWPRRSVLALGAVAVAAAGAVAAAFLLWPEAAAERGLVRHDDFSGRYWWPEGRYASPVTASAELADGRYRLTVASQGNLPASANVDTSRHDDVLVSARASGTGAYGVWCRGNPPRRPTAKYEFHVTGTGEAAIVKRAPAGQGTDLVPFRRAFTPASTNHIEARCRNAPGGGVRLTLTVNGRHAATATDTSAPLGPGAVGVITHARDVPEAAAAFDTFTVEAP